jgi:hypothetical protein
MPPDHTRSKRRTFGVYAFSVDAPDLPPFKPMLQSVVKMAFTAGLQALASRGQRMEAIKTDKKALSVFLRGCHRGYDKAQQRIGSEVLTLQEQIDTGEADLSSLRQIKDPGRNAVYRRIVILRNRQLALRRVLDSILHVITNFDTWILRRLLLEDRVYPIDKEVLKRALEVATQRNSENRLRFALVSDLSTIVQIGDLVEISFADGVRSWSVIELKEGKVNEILSGELKRHELDEAAMEQAVRESLGVKAVRQVRRMKRQVNRLRELNKIIATDKGADPNTNVPIILTPDKVITDNYLEAIGRIVGSARAKGVGGAMLPGGLYLVALRADQAVGDYLGAVAHTFYHMRYPDRECRLAKGKERASEELRAMDDGTVFVDLVAHSMHSQWGTPVYYWLKPAETPDLVVGDVRIFAQFDADAFFALAAEDGIQLSWVTGKEAERLKTEKLSRRIPGSPDAWGIRAVLPDGTKQTLVAGFIARVIADLTTPRQLIEFIKRHPEQMRKAGLNPEEFE